MISVYRAEESTRLVNSTTEIAIVAQDTSQGRAFGSGHESKCPLWPRVQPDMVDRQSPTESDGIDCTKSRMGGKLSYTNKNIIFPHLRIKKASKCTPDQSSFVLFDSDNSHSPPADSSLPSRSVPSHLQPVSWTSRKSLNNNHKRKSQPTMSLSPLDLRGPFSPRS